VSLKLDCVESIVFQFLEEMPRPLGFDICRLTGFLHHFPLARDTSYLAVLDQVLVYGFAIVGRRHPAELILMIVRRLLVFRAWRGQNSRIFRHRSTGCDLSMEVTKVTQTDLISPGESEIIGRLWFQTLDDVQST